MFNKDHPLYHTYKSMVGRCAQTSGPNFKNYKGKGVYVCERWLIRTIGFQNFIADMGPKPDPKYTLDRIDSNGPYTPENCHWASRREQMLNTSRTRFFERDGVRYKVSEVAEEYGISPPAVKARADQGLPFHEIISKHHLAEGYTHMEALRAKGTATLLAKTACIHGHEYTPENLVIRKEGWRTCRECNRIKARNFYHARKARMSG